MAFDFLGTFNRSQFERFVLFARAQVPLIDSKIQHLESEIGRLGTLQMVFDAAGKPQGYAPPSAVTYLGRLVGVYEVLGGDPFYDLQIRPITDPVFVVAGDETNTAKMMSNGEPIPELGQADAESGNLVRKMKLTLEDTLLRRGNLERKIRRVVDYGDQLASEILRLKAMKASVETSGSLENVIAKVGELFADKTYRSIIDDNGQDPFGKYIRARFSSYEPNAKRPPGGVGVERTESGYYIYGEDPSTKTGGGEKL